MKIKFLLSLIILVFVIGCESTDSIRSNIRSNVSSVLSQHSQSADTRFAMTGLYYDGKSVWYEEYWIVGENSIKRINPRYPSSVSVLQFSEIRSVERRQGRVAGWDSNGVILNLHSSSPIHYLVKSYHEVHGGMSGNSAWFDEHINGMQADIFAVDRLVDLINGNEAPTLQSAPTTSSYRSNSPQRYQSEQTHKRQQMYAPTSGRSTGHSPVKWRKSFEFESISGRAKLINLPDGNYAYLAVTNIPGQGSRIIVARKKGFLGSISGTLVNAHYREDGYIGTHEIFGKSYSIHSETGTSLVGRYVVTFTEL